MQWKLVSILSIVFVAAFTCNAHAGVDSFESKLQEADRIRSSNPQRYSELLRQLREESPSASLLQQQRLKYLQAYEAGVYLDKVGQGADLAQKLFNETKDINLKYRAGGLAVNFSAINRDFSSGLRYLENAGAVVTARTCGQTPRLPPQARTCSCGRTVAVNHRSAATLPTSQRKRRIKSSLSASWLGVPP